MRYQDVITNLRESYDANAAERDRSTREPWKLAERGAFLDRLRAGNCRRLLEIGAGAGHDSLFFQQQGLDVVASDLSPQMVARCRARGLPARVADFLHLDFPPASFDAVYAFNCVLHVPNADLPAVLDAVRQLLRPGGLFFLGVYGGESWEGVHGTDDHKPPRFFSRRTDEQLQAFAGASFSIEDFHVVALDRHQFQSMTLRRDR